MSRPWCRTSDGHITCCDEAGPCGFRRQRALHARCIACDVIASAPIPGRAGTNSIDGPLFRHGPILRPDEHRFAPGQR